MTNAEKYKKEIEKIVKPDEHAECVLAYNIKTNKLERCGVTSCADCLFFLANNKNKSPIFHCTDNCEDWLQSEYGEQSTEKDTISEEPNESEDIGEARKFKQLLFVEDGSVDMFNLYSQLSGNPEIAIIVYRQNSRTPVLANLEDEK